MGYRETLYDAVLFLHILVVIVGFGGVLLNPVYGATANRMQGAAAFGIVSANEKASLIAVKFIYAVPAFGVLLVILSDGAIKFTELWVWLSIVLYTVAMGISSAVMAPTAARMLVLLEEMATAGPPQGGPPPQAAEMEGLGKRMQTFGPVLTLFFVAVLLLMIFKPGGNVL